VSGANPPGEGPTPPAASPGTAVLEATLAAPSAPAAGPLPGSARQPPLDALRGLALLGVLAVNLPVMVGPEQRFFARPWGESAAPVALAATHLLFAGKAYALLACLFGAGLALQCGRLGQGAREVLRRRLAVLAAIGVAHGLLLWYGDILAVYAVVGLAWLLFLDERSAGSDPRWAVGLLLVLPALGSVAGCALLAVERVSPGALAPAEARAVEEAGRALARALETYGRGPAGAIFALRAREFAATFFSTLSFLPQLLGLVLLGAWAVRRGLLARPADHRAFLARVAAIGFPAGIAGELLYAALVSRGAGALGAMTLGHGIHAASAPALSLATAAALLLLWSAGRARFLLALAPLGRLSLTAYLAQSVLFTTLAYRYGFGLYGTLGPGACLALAAAAWLAQVALAQLVLSRFAMGPAEWAWRRLTYR
jgi:uncharacterized protein